ncbi:PAS domain S-box protein [Chloroflexota bacterium]
MKYLTPITRIHHFWIIAILTVVISLGYYGEQVGMGDWAPFGRKFFSSDYTHDVHRALLLIPMLYTAAVFRSKGAFVISAIVFGIVVPRGVLVSENLDPLLRAVITTSIASVACIMLGLERDRSLRMAVETAKRLESEEARSRLASIVESSEDAIIGKTLDGVVISWNRGAERLYEYSADEIIGKNISVLLPFGMADEMSQIMEKIKRDEPVERYETARVKKNGALVHVSLSISTIKDRQGTIIGASTIARDITERKQAEVALKESENRFRELFQSMSSGVAVYEAVENGEDFIFKDVNRAAEKIDILRKEEVVNKRVTDVFPEIKSFGLFEVFQRVWNTGIAEFFPEAPYQDDRITNWRENHVYRLPSGEIVALYDDVTQRKHAEDALRESEERYRTLFDSTSDGIVVRDTEGNITMVNNAMSTISGYTIDELTGMNIAHIFSNSSYERVMAKQRSLFEGSIQTSSERYELGLIRKDGAERFVEAVTSILPSIENSTKMLATLRDVTDERRARENMRTYAIQVTKAQEEERKRIARDLHDETIQELASLGLDIDYISRTDRGIPDGLLKDLEKLRDKTDKILGEVRGFTKDLRPPMIDELGLVEALQWQVDDLQLRHGINISLRIIGPKRNLSPETELLLYRIAQEALNNVRKHSNASEVTVVIEFDSSVTKLTITDNGEGFELPETIAEFAALGKLGLIGMQERVRLLNGTYTVSSKLGAGTTISVKIVE